MSGAEAAALVLGLVSSVISICEASADIWQAAHDTRGLPKKLKTAADELPLISASLDQAKININAASQQANAMDLNTWQSVQQVFQTCEESATVVQQLFDKYLPAENDDRKTRYAKILSLKRKSGEIQEHIHKILQLIQTLANQQILQDAKVLEDIKAAVRALEKPDEDEDKGGSQIMYGDGDNNYQSGSGDIRTYKNNGPAPMYNAETQNFGKVVHNYQLRDTGDKSHIVSFFKTSNYTAFKDIPNPEPGRNTCLWFLEHPTFDRWMQSGLSRILWLTADPGCGKSVLSRALVDVIFPMQTTCSQTIVYFFFKDQGIQMDICVAMSAVIHQLLCQKSHLLKHATETIDKNGAAIKDDFDQLWHLFVKLVSDRECGPVICLLDGLDECLKPDRRRLTSKLHEYCTTNHVGQKRHDEGLKFFIASRPYSDIAQSFAVMLSRAQLLRLDANAEQDKINMEIESVIRQEMKKYGSRLPLSQEQVQTAVSGILAYQNRTYLWVAYIIQEINDADPVSSAELMQVIQQLPHSLQDAYNKILMKCPNRERTLKVLSLIVAARRPLKIQELDVMLALLGHDDLEHRWYDDLRQHMAGPDARTEQIRQQCGFFVRIDDFTVHLIHQTAREFLVQKDDETRSGTSWQHCIPSPRAHELLANICIRFLLLHDFEMENERDPWQFSGQYDVYGPYEKIRIAHVFYEYADLNWTSHYRDAQLDPHHQFHLLVKRFYFPEDSALCVWLLYSETHCKATVWSHNIPNLHQKPQNALELLCLENNSAVLAQVELKLIPQTTLDQALRFSSGQGHYSIVALLLEVADPDKFYENKFNALQTAVLHSHLEIVELLLEAGAQVDGHLDIDDHDDWLEAAETALHLAILYQPSREIIETLLRHGANVHAPSALHSVLASRSGCDTCGIIQLLLKFGADINCKDMNGDTVLHIACRSRWQLDLVEVLLAAGADTNVKNEAGHTPLFSAVAMLEKIVVMDLNIFDRMLGEDSVDLNTKNQKGCSMLALLVSTDIRSFLRDDDYANVRYMTRTLLLCDRFVIPKTDWPRGFQGMLKNAVAHDPDLALERMRPDNTREQGMLQNFFNYMFELLREGWDLWNP